MLAVSGPRGRQESEIQRAVVGVERDSEIQRAIGDEKDQNVREEAIFALSQLPEERAAKALVEVIEDQRLSDEDRPHALFWLAQLDSESGMAYIESLFSGS